MITSPNRTVLRLLRSGAFSFSDGMYFAGRADGNAKRVRGIPLPSLVRENFSWLSAKIP